MRKYKWLHDIKTYHIVNMMPLISDVNVENDIKVSFHFSQEVISWHTRFKHVLF